MKFSAVEVAYNSPDELESNANIIRAELMAVATPEIKEYISNVYSSLKAVETNCAYDWKVFCFQENQNKELISDTPEINIKTPLPIDANHANEVDKKLPSLIDIEEISAAVSANDGRRLISTLTHSLLLNRFKSAAPLKDADEITPQYEVKPLKPSPHLAPPAEQLQAHGNIKSAVMKEEDLARVPERRTLFGHHDSDSDSDSDEDEEKITHTTRSVKPKPSPKASPKMKLKPDPKKAQMLGPPFPNAPLKYGGKEEPTVTLNVDSPAADREEHEHELEHDGPPHPPCGEPEGPVIPPDDVFVGALGFGAQADMCMYKNYQQLSVPCQQSIQGLYSTRQEYWASTQAVPPPPPPPHVIFGGLIFPLLYFLLIGCALKRYGYGIKCGHRREMKMKVHKIFDAIKANPELKAAVESAAGEQIPEPPARCMGRMSFGKRILFVLFNSFIIFLIGISSLIITGHLLGELFDHHPSIVVALMTLLAVVSGEIFLFKKLLNCRNQQSTVSGEGSPAVNNDSMSARIFAPLQSLNIFGMRRGNRSVGYSPLINGEEGERADAEMVDIRQQHQHQQQHTAVPVFIQTQQTHTTPYSAYPGVPIQGVVYAPTVVAANPMSNVRMV